ncbi:hypothetical protein [Acaryochloris marina]|nr:hypothetical protein [Acaryochloris marina]
MLPHREEAPTQRSQTDLAYPRHTAAVPVPSVGYHSFFNSPARGA